MARKGRTVKSDVEIIETLWIAWRLRRGVGAMVPRSGEPEAAFWSFEMRNA